MTEGGFVGGSWLKTNRARVEDVRNPRFKRWLREPTEKANRDEFDLAADRYAGRHGAPSGTAKTANGGSGRAGQVALRTRRMPLGTARQRVPVACRFAHYGHELTQVGAVLVLPGGQWPAAIAFKQTVLQT